MTGPHPHPHPHPHGPEQRTAGIVTRVLCAAIDLGVVLTMVGATYLGLTFVRLLFSPQNFTFPEPHALLSVSTSLMLSVLYLTVCWATTGRTVGAIAMGLRVVTIRNRKLRWTVAAARAALCVFFGIGLAWVAVDPQRRSLQDIALRTRVVYDWDQNPELVSG